MKIVPIPGFSRYFAGEDGMIYSSHGKGNQLKRLIHNVQTSGKYYVVNLKKDTDTKRKSQRVHRMVCLAFHGEPISENMTASHQDGNWRNNNPENLKWESYSDNLNRKKEHGTDDIGIKNSRAKIDLETLILIRKLLSHGLTHTFIGNKLGLNRAFISKIANGSRYKGQGI